MSALLERFKDGTATAEDYAILSPGAMRSYATQGKWGLPDHQALIDQKLMWLVGTPGARLMIDLPPRHGKSELCSHALPVWALGLHPDWRVMLGSYQHHFAASWGLKARDTMHLVGDRLFGIQVSKNRRSAEDWGVNSGGGMVSTGVGGAFTGRGADLMILDDLIKGPEEAASLVYRDKMWDWYRATIYSRLQPGGRVVVVMTRWHLDDLRGRLLAQAQDTGEQWETLHLPARAVEGEEDPLGREPGAPLWPQQYGDEALAMIENVQGPYYWQALYQGNPVPGEGVLFVESDWRFWSEQPKVKRQFLSVDCAFKDERDSSYVVIQVWGERLPELYLLEQDRRRMDYHGTVEAIKRMSADWPDARHKYIEDKANGPAVISALQREVSGVAAVNPRGGKWSRAEAASRLQKQGHVWIPQPAQKAWVYDFLREAGSFPHGRHTDQVDAMSQALEPYVGRSVPGQSKPKRPAHPLDRVWQQMERMFRGGGGKEGYIHPSGMN